jgi:hypothetical protein
MYLKITRVGQTQHLFSWRRISQSEIRNSAAAKKFSALLIPAITIGAGYILDKKKQ